MSGFETIWSLVLAGTTVRTPFGTMTPCRHCGYPIHRLDEWKGEPGPWFHVFPSVTESHIRGCRAAAYTRLGAWDDSLPRRRTAAAVEPLPRARVAW